MGLAKVGTTPTSSRQQSAAIGNHRARSVDPVGLPQLWNRDSALYDIERRLFSTTAIILLDNVVLGLLV